MSDVLGWVEDVRVAGARCRTNLGAVREVLRSSTR